MPKVLKVSDDVYEALQILKRYPLTSIDEVIKGLIDQVCPDVFFDNTDDIERELFRETIGLDDYSPGEFRQYVKVIKGRKKKNETKIF
jgi:hypothetical protein